MKAKVHVTLKNGVLDPQGVAIAAALGHLGFDKVDGVRVGKYIELDLAETNAQDATDTVKKMCDALLANTVVEKYQIELTE